MDMKYLLSEKNLTYIVNHLSEAMSPDDMVNVYKIPFNIDGKNYYYYSISAKKSLDKIIPNLIAQAKSRFKRNKYKEITDTTPEDSYLYQWIVDKIITETNGNVASLDDKRFFTNYLKTFFGEPESITPEPIKRSEANAMRKDLFSRDGDSFKSRMSTMKRENPEAFDEMMKTLYPSSVKIPTKISDYLRKILASGRERVELGILKPNAITLWNNISKYKNDDPKSNNFMRVSLKFFRGLIDNPEFQSEPGYDRFNEEIKYIIQDPQLKRLNSKIMGMSDLQTYRLVPITKDLSFWNYVYKLKTGDTKVLNPQDIKLQYAQKKLTKKR